ncbi:hypothetical protein [Cyanobium sp. NIES-981]|uniref:hypothetical protein n=1 Tax=Cyanobium sp. NIES-981 TaxID=1851505 RepID=UPI0012F7FA3E|nr:hypothetical protein [Cyanobium sp. NIES-981]
MPTSQPTPWGRARGAALGLVLVTVTAGALLGGCQQGQQRQQQGETRRQEQALQAAATAQRRDLDALVERCQAGQAELVTAAAALSAAEAALAGLEQRRYSPLPRPPAPDPAVLQRYSISDQELELERHQQALQAWEQEERGRRSRWREEQRQERQRLQARLQRQRQALSAANPAVLSPAPEAKLNREALAAFRSCKRETLASLGS